MHLSAIHQRASGVQQQCSTARAVPWLNSASSAKVQRPQVCVSVVAPAQAAPPAVKQQQRPVQLHNTTAGIRSLSSRDIDDGSSPGSIAYEIIQGPLARWTRHGPGQPAPTAVLVHGILGKRQNLQSFATMIAQGFPSWQVLLVDLRCHGETARLPPHMQPSGQHSVNTAAADVLRLLNELKLFPTMLIGHSFGGKVVMSMVQQFGRASLPRPVQVWCLDALPGDVRAGDVGGRNQPGLLIDALRSMPTPMSSRNTVTETLLHKGFSEPVARWAATNLRPMTPSPANGTGRHAGGISGGGGGGARLGWSVDLDGIAELYKSYESTSLWPLLEKPPQGLRLDFVRAEKSSFKWAGDEQSRIEACGHRVHLLHNSGHWVHTDNPMGLFDILAPSFGVEVDLSLKHARSFN